MPVSTYNACFAPARDLVYLRHRHGPCRIDAADARFPRFGGFTALRDQHSPASCFASWSATASPPRHGDLASLVPFEAVTAPVTLSRAVTMRSFLSWTTAVACSTS